MWYGQTIGHLNREWGIIGTKIVINCLIITSLTNTKCENTQCPVLSYKKQA